MNYARLFLLLLSLLAFRVEAGLIATVHKDTAHAARISWLWDGEIPADESVRLPDWGGRYGIQLWADGVPDILGLLEIEHFLEQDLYSGNAIGPIGIIAPLLIFGNVDSIGTLMDYRFSIEDAQYHFLFIKEQNPFDSTIVLSMQRVPVPATLLLVLAGFIPMMWRRRPC